MVLSRRSSRPVKEMTNKKNNDSNEGISIAFGLYMC